MILKGLRGEKYFLDPFPQFDEMEKKIRCLNDEIRSLFELFLLGKRVRRENFGSLILEEDIQNLKEIGLIVEEDSCLRTDGYTIIPYLEHYFLLNLPTHYPTSHKKIPLVYMGRDSYRLAQNLLNGETTSGKTILDLCTGGGIQAILGAGNCKKVVGVEINPKAANVARFNCILNGLDRKVEILQGDLYGPVASQKFDIIYANPPFVPVPPGLIYSVYGDGGIDGLKIIRRLLDGLDVHLKEGGQSIIVGDGIGDSENPFFVRQLKDLAHKMGWNVRVILYGGPYEHLLLPIYFHRLLANALVPDSFNKKELISCWMKCYKEMGAEYFYTFTIKIVKKKPSSIEIIRLYNPWRVEDRPILQKGIEVKSYLFGAKVFKGKESFLVGNDEHEVLRRCDGKTQVLEIAKAIFNLHPKVFGDLGIDGATQRALDLCYDLEQKGVILRGNG
jgi:HemK-related putative methylase